MNRPGSGSFEGRPVAVIGAGVIGAGWAAFFALSGLDVRVVDPSPAARAAVDLALERARPVMQALGLLSDKPTVPLVTADVALAVQGAVHIQEALPENLALKHGVYVELERHAPAEAVIASSSSAIKPSLLQQGLSRPGRLLVAHPCNPPYLMPSVEIVGGSATEAWAIDEARAFYTGLGKEVIVLRKEVTGHLINRLQAALWREAVSLVVDGVASVEDVDHAVTAGLGARWSVCGPHQIFHLSGGERGMEAFLERLGPAVETWWNDLGQPTLDASTRAALIDGMREAAHGLSVAQLGELRDRKVVDVMAFLQGLED